MERAAGTTGGDFDWPAFRQEIDRAARAHLDGGRRDEAAAARAVQDRAEAALARHPRPPSLVACGPGCGHCCVLNVAVLEPEAAALADYLHETRPAAARDDLRRALADLERASRWLDDEERLMLRRSCALLDGAGRCSVHPARPLLCRQVTSIDPDDCLRAVTLPALGEHPPVTADLFHGEIFAQAFLAFGRTLAGLGRESRSRRLCEALLERL